MDRLVETVYIWMQDKFYEDMDGRIVVMLGFPHRLNGSGQYENT